MEEKHSSKDATDNAINIIQNNNLLLDATIETIKSARRILWLITTMVCLGFFFIYLWYFSWENARIVARNGICNIKSNEIKAKDYKGNLNLDTALISKYKKEAQNLENEISNKKYNLPLVGINISISDFSIGIMMVSTALLVWLYLYLNRLFSCLETLKKKKGWRIIISLLKFHFVIIGSHSEKYIKYISKTLILSLPLLSFLFLLNFYLTELFLRFYFSNHPKDWLVCL